jgi:hypothetical protein
VIRFLWTPTSIKKHRREEFDIINSALARFKFRKIKFHHQLHFIMMFMNKVSCSDFYGHQKFIKKHRHEGFHIINKI